MTNTDTLNPIPRPSRKMDEQDSIDIIVKDLLSEKLGLDFSSIQDDKSFQDDLGIDSLDFTEIILDLENKFKISISDEESEKLKTVKKLTLFIKEKIK